MSIYCYIRVSTKEQNTDRQSDILRKYCLDKGYRGVSYFFEKMSGKNFNRPKYNYIREHTQSGDTIVILSLDRMGRNYTEIIDEWRYFESKEVNIEVVDMPLLSTSNEGLERKFLNNLVLQILSYVAEKERTISKERQRQGIESAKARGVKFGRPSKNYDITPVLDYMRHKISLNEARERYKGSKGQFFRKLKEERMKCKI